MLGERQVAAPLMAQRATHGALRPAHRRFQPGQGVGVQLAGLRMSRKPQRPSQRQFGHKTPVPGFALIAPAAPRPGQHRAVRRQRGRQVAPSGHVSTVRQRLLRLVRPDGPATAGARSCEARHAQVCPLEVPPFRLSASCLDVGGQAVEQEGFGSGEADREEQRDLICSGRGDLASADCPQGDEPLGGAGYRPARSAGGRRRSGPGSR